MKTKAMTSREEIFSKTLKRIKAMGLHRGEYCTVEAEIANNAIKEADEIKDGPSELDKSFMKNTEREEYPNKTFEECKSSLELMANKFYWMRDKLWNIWGME